MDKIHLKFCGLRTREEISLVNDLSLAGEAAPDHIGFVFAGSKRRITEEQALMLRSILIPGIRIAAVLVNAPVREAAGLVRKGIADMLQLHGDEDGVYIETLRSLIRCPVIKAIRLPVRQDTDVSATGQTRKLALQALQEAQAADYYLFDADVPGLYGGSGKRADLTLLADLPVEKPFFLAGGLTAETVGKAIGFLAGAKNLAPYFYGVDVSGGIETKGSKDSEKMKDFAQAVRLAEAQYK